MNHYFAYKLKPKCLEKQEIDDWAKFIKRRKLELLDNGKAKGRLEHDDVTFVCDFYSIVFNRQLWYPECYSCRGTALTLIKMMKQLDVVYYSNLNMPKDETT